ncbi:GNAT family N-acetyltransferase [Ideonella paludis]|uniref:GNAT family N-acetyltransferase n=1 Tax=Ideonella paludis TaxID=1233411 RepID=UPI001B35D184|nr:GNAT family N-acetyltransferase [Ideonella paludis]
MTQAHSLTWRPAKASDGPLAYRIEEDAMRPYAEATWGCWLPAADPDGFIAQFDPQHHFIVELNGAPIGVIAVKEQDDAVLLEKLYLGHEHRNVGVGAALLADVVATAQAIGKPVRLRALAVNVRAQAFYLRHGFEVTHQDAQRVHFVKWPRDPASAHPLAPSYLNRSSEMDGQDFDDPPEDSVRDAQTIARRALVLMCVVAIALGDDKQKLVAWLRSSGLWVELSPNELDFITADEPNERQVINASWRSEALLLLLWSLDLVPKIPAATEVCDPAAFKALLPPWVQESATQFIEGARRRSDESLWEMSNELLDLHWTARDARINDRDCPNVNIGIIQERHHGINWIIGYGGAPWDEVATDT